MSIRCKENPEKYREISRKRYINNKERHKLCVKKYMQDEKHIQAARASWRRYYERNKEKIMEKNKQYARKKRLLSSIDGNAQVFRKKKLPRGLQDCKI